MTRIWTWLWIFLVFACQSALCENSVSLYLDDGTAENGFRMGAGMGHSVLFEAPSGDWTLSSVAVYGKLEPEPERASEIFVLEIWDEDLNAISKVTDRADAFFGEDFGWAVVDVPDVRVSGPFLISLYEFGGIYVGTDICPSTNRSFISARNPNRILAWNLGMYQQNETEWMIRATGISPPPEVVDLQVLSEVAGSGETIEVEVRDPDHNLKSATLYVVENASREVVWSCARDVEGGEARVTFSWPGTFYMVTGPDGSVSPVLTSEVVDVSEKFRPLLARSSPCVLLLDSGESMASAYAYFGDDGDLNGLVDLSGQVHYVSRDVLNVTARGVDYMTYLAKNVTAIKGEAAVVFYNVSALADGTIFFGYHQPMILSRSPLFNYRIGLEEVEAKAGDYVPIVVVEDRAYNSAWFNGLAEVEVV